MSGDSVQKREHGVDHLKGTRQKMSMAVFLGLNPSHNNDQDAIKHEN